MSHWAEIDETKKVIRVVVGPNDEPDEGYQWLIDNFGGNWIKTSYNTYGGVHILGGTPFRKNYAGIGSSYDSTRDAFIPLKPYSSWILNEETCLWEAPLPKPENGYWEWNNDIENWKEIKWNESSQSWEFI
jgi:hypothetical protein